MKNRKIFSLASSVFALSDLLFLTIVFYILLLIRYQFSVTPENLKILIHAHYKANILLILFWILSANYTSLYKFSRFDRFLILIRKVFPHIFIFSIILFAISGLKKEDLFSVVLSIYFLAVIFIYLVLTRTAYHFLLKYFHQKGFNLKDLIIIGYNDNAANLTDILNNRKDLGLQLKDIFVSHDPTENQKEFELQEFDKYLNRNRIDFAYICLGNGIQDGDINAITGVLEKNFVKVGFIPNTALEIRQSLEITYLDAFPILVYKKYPLDHLINRLIKRVFDIIFTLLIFVLLLWWLLPLLALMVYFSQGGPIFFAQKRNGLNGREFDCLKFRTMRQDKSNNQKPTERNDPRVTKLGRILRKTSLDELPQFINVLKGEMSIVGPRPHMVSENESYSEIIKRYALRHYVKPGITGLAQTKGFRGAVDSDKDMEMRIKTDIFYVRNWSFLLDLLIIYKTIKLMIVGDENAI